MDNKQLERTAYHEAGHAVMAWLCGLSVSEAMISECGGWVRHEPCEALQEALIAAAGSAAEVLCIGDIWHEAHYADADMLTQAGSEDVLFSEVAHLLMSEQALMLAKFARQEAMFRCFVMVSASALWHHRPEIADLALALREQGKLEDVSIWLSFRSPHGGRLSRRRFLATVPQKPEPSEVIDWLTRPLA